MIIVSTSRPQRKVVVSVIIVSILALAAFITLIEYYGGSSSFHGITVTFTIIESDNGAMEGINGSAHHLSVPWPVIHVQKGDRVVIHVININSSEPHGFAITHYFDAGVKLSPGDSYTLTFIANEAGSFRMYCNIYCAIHPLMQNGQLIVS